MKVHDRAVPRLLIVLLLLAFARCSTYRSVLGKSEVRYIVVREVQNVRGVTVQEDFVEWSVESIEACMAPSDQEEARRALTQRFHKFVEGLLEYLLDRGHTMMTAASGRSFLNSTAKCGMTPCPKKCCAGCVPCPKAPPSSS